MAIAHSAALAGDVLTCSNTPNQSYGSCTSVFVQEGSVIAIS